MTSARSVSWARKAVLLGTVLLPIGFGSLGTAFARAAEEDAREDSLYVSQVSAATTGDLAPGAEIVGDGRPLGIAEAVALSIRNNLDVEVERFEPLLAESDAAGAWGAYDPLVSADMSYDVAKNPNTSSLSFVSASRERTKGGGIGVDQLIPYIGASIGARYEANSLSTRETFRQLDEQFNSSFFLTARVPLARDLIWNEAWTNVKLSGIRSDSALDGFQSALMDVVRETVDAYWALVAARDRVRVAQKSLETARALLEQTNTEYEVGVKSRVEVVEAEAGVADRESQLIETANAYRNAQDALIDSVLGRELGALTDLQLAPTADPEDYQTRQVDVAKAVRLAFQKRPELSQANREIEQGEVQLKFAKNQRLPQFDAEVRFGYRGVSGEGNAGVFDFSSGMLTQGTPAGPFDASDNDFFKGQGAENIRVTGTFSIPFPNTTARKQVVRRGLELRRAKSGRVRLEQGIILEVREAARTLLAADQGILAAERRRLSAAEQLRAERIKLEHGESTPFDVLLREEALVEAESDKIRALQVYRAAEVGLDRAQGTILDVYNVVMDDAREPTPSP